MKTLPVAFAFAAALMMGTTLGSAPSMAANARHPHSNVNHNVDQGGSTGDAQVDQLNARELNRVQSGQPGGPQALLGNGQGSSQGSGQGMSQGMSQGNQGLGAPLSNGSQNSQAITNAGGALGTSGGTSGSGSSGTGSSGSSTSGTTE